MISAQPALLAAFKVLFALIEQGSSFNTTLPFWLNKLKEPSQQAITQDICYGVARWYFQLTALAKVLFKKSLKRKDADIYIFILMGLYEVLYRDIPKAIAVSEIDDAVRGHGKPWAVTFVNAVLRNCIRHQEKWMEEISALPSALYAHPLWFIKDMQAVWPMHWQSILEANNRHPPMSLRVNQRITDRESSLKKLEQQGIQASASPFSACGLILEKPMPVSELPGFKEGEVSVQDIGAQFAAPLLDLTPGLNVLDACAAPGGKLSHILEMEPNLGSVTAIDQDAERLKKVSENLLRLHASAEVLSANVIDTQTWWTGKRFDRILLDAPCSGTGVIRRHPDIKLLHRRSDIHSSANTQQQLLQALWPLLKPQGKLVYVTCSIFPEENEHVIAQFIKTHSEVESLPIQSDWGLSLTHGKQILPGQEKENMDGFYYAVLKKTGG